MSYHARKNIITDGLVFQTDAANKLSKRDDSTVGTYATGFAVAESLEVQANTIFNFGDTDFTIVAWVRRNTGTGLKTALGKSNGSVANYSLVSQAGNWEWRVSSTGFAGGRTILNFGATSLGTWQHIVLVNDSTNNEIRAYLDGVESIAAHANGSFASTTHPFTVGDRHFNSGSPWDEGDIDNVSVYDKAFVQADATTSYNSGVRLQYPSIDQVNLLSHYSLDEGIGFNRVDSHGSNDMIENGSGGVSNATESDFVAVNLSNPTEIGVLNGDASFLNDLFVFDGAGDYIDFQTGNSAAFGTGDFTVELVLKSTDINYNIINPQTSTGVGFWGLIRQGDKLRWNHQYAVSNLWEVNETIDMGDGEIHHIVVSRISNNVTVYFDTVSQPLTVSTDNNDYSGVEDLRIGSGNLSDMDGSISLIRLYKGKGLIQSEVDNNYLALKHRF